MNHTHTIKIRDRSTYTPVYICCKKYPSWLQHMQICFLSLPSMTFEKKKNTPYLEPSLGQNTHLRLILKTPHSPFHPSPSSILRVNQTSLFELLCSRNLCSVTLSSCLQQDKRAQAFALYSPTLWWMNLAKMSHDTTAPKASKAKRCPHFFQSSSKTSILDICFLAENTHH